LVKETVKELHKLHPNVVQCNSISDSEGAMNKAINELCVSIKSLGTHWMHSDEWMVKSKKDDVANGDLEKHELQNIKSAKMDRQVAEDVEGKNKDGNVRVQVEILVPPSSLKSIVGAANVQLVPEAGSPSSSAERPSISAS
nr:hypothetical protein [Tanacetum cinerariifolium]